ncbi:saccharopine dehydrogenase NADP-binding domain-containing protein [Halosimplex aquaticum]
MADLLVYGSYGFTGSLIVDEALDRGLDVIVAGRDRNAVENQAIRQKCDERVFSLDEPRLVDHALEEVEAVLHCAGPFADTAEPMVEGCLRTGTHYLDITGEIEVFERLAGYDDEAAEAGVMVLPGVGFDVVPTDCLAAHLAERVPDADRIALGFEASGGSPRAPRRRLSADSATAARSGGTGASRWYQSGSTLAGSTSAEANAPRWRSPGATCRPPTTRPGSRPSPSTPPSPRGSLVRPVSANCSARSPVPARCSRCSNRWSTPGSTVRTSASEETAGATSGARPRRPTAIGRSRGSSRPRPTA